MPPALLFEHKPAEADALVADLDQIYQVLPQREEFVQLHGITHLDPERHEVAGFRDVTADEFWVRGHIPGRPLFPGVLMIESAAQLVSYATLKLLLRKDCFLGMGGVDKFKFRGAVAPGQRIILLGKLLEARSRTLRWACQGLVEDRLVFQGEIMGMQI